MNVKKIFSQLIEHPLWGKRLCPFPFNRLEIGTGNDFVPCCRDWINYHELPKNDGALIWNGHQAELLRKSMLDGSMRYCDQKKCNSLTLSRSQLIFFFLFGAFLKKYPYHSLSLRSLLEVLRSKTHLNTGPAHVSYTKEESCNLKCGSCRHDHLQDTKSDDERRFLIEEFKSLAGKAETILFSGGEVFFGKTSLALLKSIGPKHFPHLKKVTVMTNGLLLNEKMWNDLGDARRYIKRIMVSVDAGTSEHYRIVRGGNFSALLDNLNFLSALRKNGEIEFLSLQFVPRLANFESMLSCVQMGERLGVDRVLFQTYCKWDNSDLDYFSEAIHLPRHPRHGEFLTMSALVKMRSKVVWNVE